jgi:hypothetical protein
MNTTEARGKAAFFEEGFGRLGKPASRIGSRKPGMLYEPGWGKGMTQAEAQAALERRWEQMGVEGRERYAMRGGDGAFAPSEMQVGSVGATKPTEGVPAMLERPQDMATDERMNADPAVKAAYEAKRAVPREAQVTTPAASVKPEQNPLTQARPWSRGQKPAANSDLPTDDRMRARPEVAAAYEAKRAGVPSAISKPIEASPATGVPALLQKPPTPTPSTDGQRVLGDVDAGKASASIGTRVNVATGMPFGYVPGAALPADADAAMKQRAADSVARQRSATGTPMFEGGIAIPKAVAVSETPKPMDTSMFASDRRIEAGRKQFLANEARVAAGSNDGLRAVGPKKPLDELVRGRIPFARRG